MPRKNKKTGIKIRGPDPKRTRYHRKYYPLRNKKTGKRKK